MQQGSRIPELFAYQATIVRAERNYEAGWWVAYDRQFRREALARKDLNCRPPTHACLVRYSLGGRSQYQDVPSAYRRTILRRGAHKIRTNHGWGECHIHPSGRVGDRVDDRTKCAEGLMRSLPVGNLPL